MNKTAIKNFAVWARNKLIADISYKAGLLGITQNGIASALPQSTGTTEFYDIGTAEPYAINGDEIRQRNRLVEMIERKAKETDYKTAYNYIIEEVAYTWFNRLIAIRFMEVNDYLPSHIRVLSSESGKTEPDLVTNPFDSGLEFSEKEKQLIYEFKQENKIDELFHQIFIKQCNDLNKYLPELFEETNDYTELLINLSVIDKEGVIAHLINDIPEDNFNIEKEGQVEIIGWLYQFYNIEPKNEVFSKKGKLSKDEIPAATQLFTPRWIVRYMVENSLGRLWLDGHKNKDLERSFEYYLSDAIQNEHVQTKVYELNKKYELLDPIDIKIIDPAMGSGHILVYCFDMLMRIYEAQGYAKRDAAQYILSNNIFGLDIDKRAAQLSYFSIMMKAREYDRRILERDIRPNLYSIEESNNINRSHFSFFGQTLNVLEKNNAITQINSLMDELIDSKEYGSIIKMKDYDWDLLERFISHFSDEDQISIGTIGIEETQKKTSMLIHIAKMMAQKYHVVITNPPYMRNRGMNAKLTKYIKKYYESYKFDLYAVFISRCQELLMDNAYLAMITQHSFMFLSRFEQIREDFNNKCIINMLHLGTKAFEEIGGEVVQTTTFVVRNNKIPDFEAKYHRLVDFDASEKEKQFLLKSNEYICNQEKYRTIPGSSIAYWVSDQVISAFNKGVLLDDVAYPRKGNSTSDNDRFLKLWFEVEIQNINLGATEIIKEETMKKRWFPYNKGGSFRKWYGNNDYVVDWKNDAAEMRAIPSAVIANYQFFTKPGVTWSTISGGDIGVRRFGNGYIFDNKGECLFCDKEENLNFFAAFLNCKPAMKFLSFLTPTLDFNCGYIAKLPIIMPSNELLERINQLVDENVRLMKTDWDSFERSWDFKMHPLVSIARKQRRNLTGINLEDCYIQWDIECAERFEKLKYNEYELNKIFIDLYDLKEELAPDVSDDSITMEKADIRRDMHNLLSYAVGCMFGRYSMDVDGLSYAGGDWNETYYSSFVPDNDNCIPITDEEYFEDDIVARFCDWMKVAFGTSNLEANLDFVAKGLGNKGNTSREVIRNYFSNDFYKDHCAAYSVTGSGKRPIYWMFDSGKKNGFKALVYMHRWNADTIGNLRIDYLHRAQRTFESEINRMQDMIDNSTNNREVATATKRKEKLQKQLKECREYDEKIGHLALSRIEIDLDDGVKVNYEKVQTASDGKKYQVLVKI